MTIDKLKCEKLAPCKCGRKRGVKQWFCTDGSCVIFYKCDYCGLEAPGAKTMREARTNWNKTVVNEESKGMLSGDCNICINGKMPSYSTTCVECGLSRKNFKPITKIE